MFQNLLYVFVIVTIYLIIEEYTNINLIWSSSNKITLNEDNINTSILHK